MSSATTFSSFATTTSTIRIQTSKRSSSSCSVRISAHAAAATETTATMVEGRRRMGLYGVLGVKETASAAEIKAAYRALAKQYHPDVIDNNINNGHRSPDQLFMEIHKAYSTLSDPKEREKYDAHHTMFIGFGLNNNNNKASAAAAQGADGRWFRSSRRWETDQCW